jgi:hypothetical protein
VRRRLVEPILLSNPVDQSRALVVNRDICQCAVANVAVELLLEGDCCTRMGDRYIHSAVEADCTTHERTIQPAFQRDQATAERYTVAKPNCEASQGQVLRHHR